MKELNTTHLKLKKIKSERYINDLKNNSFNVFRRSFNGILKSWFSD